MGNAEELCRLAVLLEKGLITQEEFKIEKAKLLGTPPPGQNNASLEMVKARDLAGLALLLDRGLITDEEFKIEKKKLFKESETIVNHPPPPIPPAPPTVQNINVTVEQTQSIKVKKEGCLGGCTSGCFFWVLAIIILAYILFLISDFKIWQKENKTNNTRQTRSVKAPNNDTDPLVTPTELIKTPIAAPTKPSVREQFLEQERQKQKEIRKESIQAEPYSVQDSTAEPAAPEVRKTVVRKKAIVPPKIDIVEPREVVPIPKVEIKEESEHEIIETK